VLILWLFYWWVAVVTNLRPEDFFTPRTWCTNKGPGSNMKLQNLLREKTFNSSSSSSFFFFIRQTGGRSWNSHWGEDLKLLATKPNLDS
jgi:hypothetical protein